MNSDTDVMLLKVLMVVIVCITIGGMQNCHFNHELEMACLNKGWHFYPNNTCHSEPK